VLIARGFCRYSGRGYISPGGNFVLSVFSEMIREVVNEIFV